MNNQDEQQEQQRVTFISDLLNQKINKTKQDVEDAKTEAQKSKTMASTPQLTI